MGKATATAKTPLFCQSKLLCFSLLYLFTTLLLAFHHKISPNKCFFRSSPFDPIQSPLFHYPPSYGEHKHAIPTHRNSCSSPVLFSDYGKVAEEIHNLCKSTSAFLPALRYLQGKAETFGGNFSFNERISYFNDSNNDSYVPCGFLKEFPVSDSDRIAMESCNGVVVASAIFNDHDKIRQPIGLGPKTPEIACFFMFIDDITLQGLYYHKLIPQNSPDYNKVGVWRIVKDDDMAMSKHPYYIHTMEEAMATARWRKWSDMDGLTRQMETYCENGLQPWTPDKHPYTTAVKFLESKYNKISFVFGI
ncbi:hypothetical protein V6N13_015632 [Hibiscus sabdariffa]